MLNVLAISIILPGSWKNMKLTVDPSSPTFRASASQVMIFAVLLSVWTEDGTLKRAGVQDGAARWGHANIMGSRSCFDHVYYGH